MYGKGYAFLNVAANWHKGRIGEEKWCDRVIWGKPGFIK
jgi:hypothetical protein